ncbi:hypothetical protein [Sinorhizobium sp. BG8]|uniref:hypothetical protein n=1 Tax=Sinorhizobium sp. BG8 TaxID=2613773 RepID=UPI00193D7DD4|nr:hypothetical protein [Sinorhizobium sp. BG8]QRM57396.1 hypothetical protein F3Y30_23145 [Sinorhizobium sp. BG8]
MHERLNFQLYFDVLSRRALLCCDGQDYMLPDVYENKEMAEAAARKFAADKFGSGKRGDEASEIAIWPR